MRTWFITGASRGFGALIAAEALAAGDSVVATARDPSKIPHAVRDHSRTLALPLDVASERQARDAVSAAIERFGRIDILVNNAGFGIIGAIEETTVIEPGYFRTTFLSDNSVVSTASRIDDYAQTVGAVRRFAQGANGQQPGDPKRLAEAVLTLVNAERPPRRLPLGADTVLRIEQKHREVEAELAQWRSTALSTGFVSDTAA